MINNRPLTIHMHRLLSNEHEPITYEILPRILRPAVLLCKVSTSHTICQSISVSDDNTQYILSTANTEHLHIQSTSVNSIIIPRNIF
jgi:hypothetical protein